jgi:hypothetical protein
MFQKERKLYLDGESKTELKDLTLVYSNYIIMLQGK